MVLKTERAARAFALLAALVPHRPARDLGALPSSRFPWSITSCRMDCAWCSRRTAHGRRFRWACTTGWAFASSRGTAPASLHLFEHMMFQGSQNLGKMEFIKLVDQNGGILNGSTRFD